MAGAVGNLVKGIMDTARPNLATFARYAMVELVPPTPGEIGAAGRGIKNIISSARTGKWKQLTVREAWLNTLVAAEVGCWFFIGECIGKMNLVGYSIKV